MNDLILFVLGLVFIECAIVLFTSLGFTLFSKEWKEAFVAVNMFIGGLILVGTGLILVVLHFPT